MSSNDQKKRIKDKLFYLYAVINFDKKNIKELKKDLEGTSFSTQCAIFNKINQYLEDIEDSEDIVKELILREENYQNDEDYSDPDPGDYDTDVQVFDEGGNKLGDESLPPEVQKIVNKLREDHLTEPDSDNKKIPTLIDFKTFMELYGTLIILNETKGIGVIEKGGKNMKPFCLDLINLNNNTPIAKNITTFE